MTTFQVELNDLHVDVTITEDVLEFSIVEDVIEVDIHVYEDIIETSIVEEDISVDLTEDIINVNIDDCCLAIGGGGDGEHHIKDFDHDDVTIEVGDLVYQDTIVYNKVNKALSNATPNPVIGIVYQVLSETMLRVLLWGNVQSEDLLVPPGTKIYVSPTGKMTTQLQHENYTHVLGMATNENELLIRPEQIRVKRLEI